MIVMMTCTEPGPAGHAGCMHTHHAMFSPLVTTGLWRNYMKLL